eukprot:1179548-Prorocentrum_minimum.AAC.1
MLSRFQVQYQAVRHYLTLTPLMHPMRTVVVSSCRNFHPLRTPSRPPPDQARSRQPKEPSISIRQSTFVDSRQHNTAQRAVFRIFP